MADTQRQVNRLVSSLRQSGGHGRMGARVRKRKVDRRVRSPGQEHVERVYQLFARPQAHLLAFFERLREGAYGACEHSRDHATTTSVLSYDERQRRTLGWLFDRELSQNELERVAGA